MRTMILACTLMILGVISQSRAQSTGILTGTVSDSLGKPIRGATIRVMGLSPARGAISREGGSFIVPNLPCGRYSIQVSAVGYHRHTVNDVEISDNSVTQLDASLKEAPNSNSCTLMISAPLIPPDKFGTIRTITFQ